MSLLPFQFGESCRRIAGIIRFEQLPARFFLSAGRFRRHSKRYPTSDQCTAVLGQTFKIAAFVFQREGPCGCRSVARDDVLCRNLSKRPERRQPTPQTAVNDRDVLQKDEIAGKERLSGLIEKC